MLQTVKISKAQALQRMGRAGRQCEGYCYRMLTKVEYDALPEESVPEILRCNLSNVLLQLLTAGVKNLEKFDFLDKPPKEAIDGAIRQLKLLGAIEDDREDSGSVQITALGRKLSRFPLDPRFSKMIWKSVEHRCT